MKYVSLITALLFSPLAAPPAQAATYTVGDVVTEITNLVDRVTGQPVPLSQLEGKILFIDFFAHWCPVCQAAAPQILTGIDEWYDTRKGNPDGIPVLHIGANLQTDSNTANRNATSAFIQRYKFPLTIQDTSRRLQGRFGPTSGQPTFVIINGLTNSPTHKPWELLYSRFSYRDSTGSRPIEAFRAAIDSVQAGPPALSNLGIIPGGGLNLTVIGGPRTPLSVEWSTNLNQWQDTGTTIPPDAAFPFALPPLQDQPSAFLRVRRAN
ncbi:MAG: hypothetical protein RIS76_996 [Verrucomicrobiota bacterium]|jgi:thiol-disulfide isomerase/thioredoxin